MKFISRFIDFLTVPDEDDHYIIEKWRKEADEENRLKDLHREARKQLNQKRKS
jgi:hypothetical protein